MLFVEQSQWEDFVSQHQDAETSVLAHVQLMQKLWESGDWASLAENLTHRSYQGFEVLWSVLSASAMGGPHAGVHVIDTITESLFDRMMDSDSEDLVLSAVGVLDPDGEDGCYSMISAPLAQVLKALVHGIQLLVGGMDLATHGQLGKGINQILTQGGKGVSLARSEATFGDLKF